MKQDGNTLDQFVGTRDEIIGMRMFGASAPLKALQKKFGFTPGSVITAARTVLAR